MVSEAILLAGGFTEVARDSRVRLTRRIPDSNESETFWINVRRILQEGDRNEDMLVKENDIINVAERIIVF
jgi:protein involved in polysaccharide export with SLBB domain